MLFPGATIVPERIPCLTKSFVVHRGFNKLQREAPAGPVTPRSERLLVQVKVEQSGTEFGI
jgi:hypothetical protein